MVVYHKPLPPTPKWGTYLRRSAADGIQKEALNQVASDKNKVASVGFRTQIDLSQQSWSTYFFRVI